MVQLLPHPQAILNNRPYHVREQPVTGERELANETEQSQTNTMTRTVISITVIPTFLDEYSTVVRHFGSPKYLYCSGICVVSTVPHNTERSKRNCCLYHTFF